MNVEINNMLTDKCKKDFEEWFEPEPTDKEDPWARALHGNMIDEFNTLKLSMQFGVYVDFFENKGIEIDITPQYSYFEYLIAWTDINFVEGITKDKNRSEVRKKVIEEANKIYNDRHIQKH